jgi:hypothetical protein
MELPAIKTNPKYGHYPWWPEDGDDWLHPEDVALARSVIPSGRIFRRDGEAGPFVMLHYGDVQLRVKRTLWHEVAYEGFDIGDWVEVLSKGMQNTPRTGVISEMEWDARERAIRYRIREVDTVIPTWYAADDLRPVEPTPELPG